jgi:hypothetical protein
MGGWVDGWMGGWVDEWMSGWVDEWMGEGAVQSDDAEGIGEWFICEEDLKKINIIIEEKITGLVRSEFMALPTRELMR